MVIARRHHEEIDLHCAQRDVLQVDTVLERTRHVARHREWQQLCQPSLKGLQSTGTAVCKRTEVKVDAALIMPDPDRETVQCVRGLGRQPECPLKTGRYLTEVES